MPIAIRYTGEVRGDFSFGGDFIVLCDFCGKEIDEEAKGNAEMLFGKEGEVKPVFFLHKECSILFRTKLEKKDGHIEPLLWRDLVSVNVNVR